MTRLKRRIIDFKKSILRFCKVLFIACVVAIFYFVFLESYKDATFYYKGNLLFASIYAFLLCCFLITYGGLKLGDFRYRDIVFSFNLAALITNTVSYFVICLFARMMLKVYPMLIIMGVQCVFSILAYRLLQGIYWRLNPPKHAIAILTNSAYELENVAKFRGKNTHFIVEKVIPEPEKIENILNELEERPAIVLGSVQPALRNAILAYSFQEKKEIILLPSLQDILVNNAKPFLLDDALTYTCRNPYLSADQLASKRMVDIVVSLILLVISTPFWLLAAIGIKLTDGGPIFYKQIRLTRNGRPFLLIKLRSMIVDAEKDTGAILARKGDKRITRIGRFIRATRIDELPQLINVLKGEISLVGPRPERPEVYDAVCKDLPEFRARLAVKGGLTGYAQLYGRYNTSYENKLRMDLHYIESAAWLLDLQLLFYTLKVLFQKESTEGILPGQDAKASEGKGPLEKAS